jgi:hypothetical protein
MCIDPMIFFVEELLRHVATEMEIFHYQERAHEGLGNKIIRPEFGEQMTDGEVERRYRLGGRSSFNRMGYGGGKTNMDRRDGNNLVLVRGLSSTRRVAQNSPTIVDRKETLTPSCLSCSSMLVPLAKARSVIFKN